MSGLQAQINALQKDVKQNRKDIDEMRAVLLGEEPSQTSKPPPRSSRIEDIDDRITITVEGNEEVARVKKFLTEGFLELSEKLTKQHGFRYVKAQYWKDSKWVRPVRR